jgi:hypothetical protein
VSGATSVHAFWFSVLVALAPAADASHRAADRAQALLDAARYPGSEACIDVALHPTSILTAPYTVEVQIQYGDWLPSSSLVEIERGIDRAVVRRTTAAGRRELELTAAQIAELDDWGQTSRVLAAATDRSMALCMHGTGFTSHLAAHAVILRRGAVELMHTAPTQPNIDDLTNGLEAFAAAWTARELHKMLDGWLHAIPAEPIPLAEAKLRLGKLPARAKAKGRAAIEARLLAHRVAAAGDRSLVALLRRKGFDDDALQLDLRTTPRAELGGRLAPLLCSRAFEVSQAALAMLDELGPDARTPLLHAAKCHLDEWAAVKILTRLSALGPDPAIDKVVDAATSTGRPLRLQVMARALRLRARGDERDLEFLERVANGPVGELLEMSDEQRIAVTELEAVASTLPGHRARIASLAAALLTRIPLHAHASYSGMSQLVDMLGRLDAKGYEAEIRRVLAHTDASVVVDAIEAIARFDLQGASGEARRQVRLYNDGKTTGAGYSWYVLPYLELLIRAEATKSTGELRRALVRLEKTDEADAWRLGSHRAVLSYFGATTSAEQAAAALEFVRAYGRPGAELTSFWLARFADEGFDERAIEGAVSEFERRASGWG